MEAAVRVTPVIGAGFFVIAATGCASAGFHPVSFAAESSTEKPDPAAGRTVHVVRNGEMKDTLTEARIRARLEAFLLEQGYVITPPDKADLYVLATFGAGERMVASTAPVFRSADVKEERNREGQVIRRTYVPDRMEYLRLPLVKNSLWLQVLSADAKYYRETGRVRNLWRGESSMIGNADLLATRIPYLLVPPMKYFGRGTQDVVTVDVRDKDLAWH
jgi:hypothetical protein